MSHDGTTMHLRATIASPQGNVGTIASPHGDGSMFGGRTRFRGPETPPPETAPRVRVPVRGSSVITGLGRSCRAELIGFASPIGRLSAILRITDEATGNTATSVVPVGLPGPIEGATRTPELMMPQSEVRARDLWARAFAAQPPRRNPARGAPDGGLRRHVRSPAIARAHHGAVRGCARQRLRNGIEKGHRVRRRA